MGAEETGLELTLAPRAVQSLLAHACLLQCVEPKRRQHEISYFDTPDLALKRARIMLRQQRDGAQRRLIVTTSSALSGGRPKRSSRELPAEEGRFDFSGIPGKTPRDVLERNRALLAPIFTTRFTQLVWQVETQSDSRIELSLERGSIESDGRRARICDVALHLKRGDAAALFDLACELQQTVPLRLAVSSKAERGYALLLDQLLPPVTARPPALTADMSQRQAFLATALACLQHLQGNEATVLSGTYDAEHIHQMRVAIRRLRSALKLFAPTLPRDFVKRWNGRWRDLGGVLGEARNWDVFEEQMLPPLVAAFPGHGEIGLLNKAVERRRSACQRRVRQEIGTPAHARLILEFLGDLFSPPFAVGKGMAHASDGRNLSNFAARRLARLSGQATSLARQLDQLDASERHQMRIAFKKLRYALEFFAPLLSPKRAKPRCKELELLQDALGQLNDLAVAQTLVNGVPGISADGLVAGWFASRHNWLLRALPEKVARFLEGRGADPGIAP